MQPPLTVRRRAGFASLLLAAWAGGLAGGCAPAASVPGTTAVPGAPEGAHRRGLEVVAVRVTAAGHLVDLRYRVADAERAEAVINSRVKPYLLHEPSGKVLAVPTTAKLGPLRSKYKPREGRVYTMLFGNPAGLVAAGDRVTWVLGEFRVEGLVVE